VSVNSSGERAIKRFDYAKRLTPEQLRRGKHRRRAGGLWDKMGQLQLDFMIAQGLEPSSVFLDIGCGPLRAGIRFVDYLDAGNYYGIDINESMLEIGYDVELPERLRAKLPRENLLCTDRFDCDFGVEFDAAIAQSVFTHIPLNDIRLCLYRVAKQMKVGGRLAATFFEAPADFAVDGVLDEAVGKRSKYSERNVFWYWPGDLEWAASFAPWQFRYIGDWGHPRNQMMVEFVRTA
jgi:SAM-dependent methyltransferase